MAQHTTPERSLAAAYAAEERAAGVGKESRLRKDPCYQLYEESLKCRCAASGTTLLGAGRAAKHQEHALMF